MINRKDKLNYLFQCIEQNDIAKVREFFVHYPELKHPSHKETLKSINDWSPAYYCARYGYFSMMKYFLEELAMAEDTAFLLLLSIHSGSLVVISYLFNSMKNQQIDLMMHLYSACNLSKINVAVYMMLKGSQVLDDDTVPQQADSAQRVWLAYNMSYGEANGLRKFYDKDRKLIYEEKEEEQTTPLSARKNWIERKALVLSMSKSRFKEKKRMLNIFRHFYIDMIKELGVMKFQQREPPETNDDKGEDNEVGMEIEHPVIERTKYYDVLKTIEEKDYLRRIWNTYLETTPV